MNQRLLCAIAVMAAFAGCVSVDEDAKKAIAALRSGDNATAIAWSEELANESSYSRRLGEVEAGRTQMLAGNLDAADGWFHKAIDEAVDREERQPKIKLADVANEVLASTITDDRTREYYLTPYELNLALEYSILVQATLGKHEDALVDARLATYIQDSLAENYGADVAKSEAGADSTTKGICDQSLAEMNDLMAETRNSWENPVLWWISGVLFEANGEYDQALQSYRKALAIRPDNPVFAADVKRLSTGKRLPKSSARLVFVCGEGFIPQRQSLKVPVPIYTMMSIDIPIYKGAAYVPKQIMIGESGRSKTAASPAVNVLSLASRDLKERMPGVVARNVARCAVQAGAQAAVNNSGNQYAQLAVFAVNTVATAVRRADTRSWCTLPNGEQVWSATVAPGKHQYVVDFGAQSKTVSVDLKAGETKIIYINGMED